MSHWISLEARFKIYTIRRILSNMLNDFSNKQILNATEKMLCLFTLETLREDVDEQGVLRRF